MRASEIMRSLRVIDFEWLSAAEGTTVTGVSAQEVEALYPSAVLDSLVDLDGKPSRIGPVYFKTNCVFSARYD